VVSLRSARARVVVAKLGMDAHWRGAIVVSKYLRDAGFEVIYLGHATPEQVATTSRDEDVQIVALSSMSGNHREETRRIMAALQKVGIKDDVAIVLGGAIGPADARTLLAEGVAAVFGPGSPGTAIVEKFTELAQYRSLDGMR
jgi:methylmalonyl-CoA mutase, C-terminal domain